MADSKVIFAFDGIETSIQCAKDDKMEDICQKYSAKIKKNINTLLFINEGNKINFDLSFEEQSKFQGNEKNEMKILVYKNKNYKIIYSKKELKIELSNKKINDIISENDKIKNMVNEVKSDIEVTNIMNNNFLVDTMNIQSQNIPKVSNNIQEDIHKNNKKLKHLLKDDNNIKNNNYKINNKNFKLTEEKPLENVKSKYILKIIFSYSNEKRKLKLIKYNKNLQNKMDIEITHYKFFSGRYIVYEENRKGKEYNFEDGLVFEGEYLNGERNGKGREYYNEMFLEFEGEYLNGERNGKGKEYYCFNTILRFEGEYLNGKKWNGKGYDNHEKVAYELKNGNGFLKEYNYKGKLIFEGEYLNGEKNGKGKEYNCFNQIIFKGEYLNNKRWNGKGYDGLNKIVYEIKNGKGFIKEYHLNNKLSFEGQYRFGQKNGKGSEFDNFGKLEFSGEYLNGKRNGNGREYFKDGLLKFEGIYLNNFRLRGREFIEGKFEYDGEYLCGKKWNGKVYNKKGDIVYIVSNGFNKIKKDNKDKFIYKRKKKLEK